VARRYADRAAEWAGSQAVSAGGTLHGYLAAAEAGAVAGTLRVPFARGESYDVWSRFAVEFQPAAGLILLDAARNPASRRK
jgi:hypothetical protein